MPTPSLTMKSPFEFLFHSPHRLDHLRVFGCACYPSLKPYRTNKLDLKTTHYIFLGYGAQYKGYICFDVSKHKLIVSRHVLFDETQYPILFPNFAKPPSSSKFCPSPPHIVHPNTFQQYPIILIPLPTVFQTTAESPHVTQSSSLSPRDLVSASPPTIVNGNSDSPFILTLHPDTTTSQVSDLQLVIFSAQMVILCRPNPSLAFLRRNKVSMLQFNLMLTQTQKFLLQLPNLLSGNMPCKRK